MEEVEELHHDLGVDVGSSSQGCFVVVDWPDDGGERLLVDEWFYFGEFVAVSS